MRHIAVAKSTGRAGGAFTVVCLSEDREQWLKARDSGVGASEIAVLLGESSWGSCLELYYRKTGEHTESTEISEAMRWGTLLEGAILAETARRAVVEVVSSGLLLRSSVHPWAMATPDGITQNGEPIEVKSIGHGYSDDEWGQQIPEKYMLQCQQQMLVTGASRCLFGALLFGSRLVWEWVPRDEERIARIIKAGSEFWRHVERREPPPSDGLPQARKALASRAVDEEPIELFESEIERELAVYERCKAAYVKADGIAKKAKLEFEAAKDELAKHLGTHRSGATATGWSIRWKTVERRGYTVQPNTYTQLEINEPK